MARRTKAKNLFIIAGPNGAGKTTFARKFLPEYVNCPNFVNADLIAQGLAPFDPRAAAIKAGKLMLQQINEYAARGMDFAFETTLSGRGYAGLLRRLKNQGYSLNLFFLWLPTPELAIERVKERVREGGHDVPPEDVRRRFDRGIRNFAGFYMAAVNSWMLFDNSGTKPILIAKSKSGDKNIVHEEIYNAIRRRAERL